MRLVCVLAGLLFSASTAGAALPPEAQRLEQALKELSGVKVDLLQRRSILITGEDVESRGILAFRPPQSFRLAYETPEPQELVVSGDSLWVVMPGEGQAQRYPFSVDAPGSEIFLLFGGKNGTLSGAFEIRQEAWGSYERALRLLPRNPEPGYPLEELRLVVGKNGLPEKLFYREVTGDTVVLSFLKYEKNPKDIEALTALRLPAGIQVIDASPPDLYDGLVEDDKP
mgnify:CR=1 FL=1